MNFGKHYILIETIYETHAVDIIQEKGEKNEDTRWIYIEKNVRNEFDYANWSEYATF